LLRFFDNAVPPALVMSIKPLSPLLPEPGSLLCALEDIPDGGAKEMVFGGETEGFRLLLLRVGNRVFGYENRCPHFSIPMHYETGVFNIYDGEVLMCAHHSAMFQIESGHCFDGPCAGATLTAVPVEMESGRVRIAHNDKLPMMRKL
jgi:nitrite reductase/ring-hydroxylating ferredoxin subunit